MYCKVYYWVEVISFSEAFTECILVENATEVEKGVHQKVKTSS